MRSTFEIRNPLSTSSIGFMLTNMDFLAEDRVTVYHPDNTTRHFLSRTYTTLLLAVEQELNVAMVMPKLDIVYVSSLPAPTIAKWGLILVGSQIKPIEGDVLYSVELRNIHKEIARSVYELFPGQLITPDWWSNRWVTQGLATYLSAVSQHLPFDGEKEFLIDSVQKVIKEDQGTLTKLQESIFGTGNINNPNLLVVRHKGKLFRYLSTLL